MCNMCKSLKCSQSITSLTEQRLLLLTRFTVTSDFENVKDWWDAAKHMVRPLTVAYLIQKNQVKRELKNVLMKEKENRKKKKIEKNSNLLKMNYCESEIKELDTIKKRIKDIEEKQKGKGFGPGYQTLKKQNQISLTMLNWKNKNQKKFNLFFV